MFITKITAFIFILIFSHNCLAQDDYSYLDNANGTSMKPILMQSIDILGTFEDENYEIVRIEYDIIQDEKISYRTLHNGYTYGLAAFGDYRIEDIDLSLYKNVDDTWVKIDEDSEVDPQAVLIVTPSNTGDYAIKIAAYKFVEGYNSAHYSLMILHD